MLTSPSLSEDCYKEIFAFCKPRERRLLSSTSRVGKDSYKNISEDISLGALTKIVRMRKDLWKIPTLKTRDALWKDCLPKILKHRAKQTLEYLVYQCENLIKLRNMRDEDVDAVDIIYEDDFIERIMTLHGLTCAMVLGENACSVLSEVSSVSCEGEVDEFIDNGGGTVVEIGAQLWCNDGCYLPLQYMVYG